MTLREGAGWQITLADLAFILFAIMASAPERPGSPAGAADRPSVPVAVAGGRDIKRWLEQQPRDPRQRLTITAFYAPGGLNAAIAGAQRLAAQAQHSGKAPRIIVQPARSNAITASLAFDQPARSSL